MIYIDQVQQVILRIFLQNSFLSSSEVHGKLLELGNDVSLVTVKRELSELKNKKLLEVQGAGRSVMYSITSYARLFVNVIAKDYCVIEPDSRYGLTSYNFNLFSSIPSDIFSTVELKELEKATDIYTQNIASQSEILKEKELERFIIELSWKSSKIEGNTYTLLDTEKLIADGVEAVGHNKDEAIMILNHKNAFKYILENISDFKKLDFQTIEHTHRLLIKDLRVGYGIRKGLVGITGSRYKPLDNVYQITEAMEHLIAAVNRVTSPYAKALLILLGISYIQPFDDGNKRTSRLVANAILLAHSHAPLSYRSVDENEYREAILVFYELNSIMSFKKIFMEQYIFAAKNYAVSGE